MPYAADIPASPLPLRLPRRLGTWLRQLGSRRPLDAETAWLQGAADLADLERRLRRLERGRPDRFEPLPP